MPSIARRGRIMPPSPIRRLAPVAEAAKQRGIRVYHLNIGQPDIPTPQVMLDTFRNHTLKVIEYGHSGGLWDYRQGLAKYYSRLGRELAPEQLIVTTAGSEAILFALLAVTDNGDEVLIPEPLYTNYNGFAVEAGVKVIPVSSRIEDGYRLPALDQIRRRITPRTKAILICNPNNPTGYVLTHEELEGLASVALEHDLFLIADEVYRDFVYDGVRHHSVLTLQGVDDRVIMVDSVSKRFSACGTRVGCLATRNAEVLDAALRFGQARLCPPTLEQMAANAALSLGPEYFETVRQEYLRRRDAAFEEIEKMPGVVAQRPKGAFYAMLKLPIDNADRFCSWLLTDFSHEKETVMLAPGNGFYATPGRGDQEARIAFVLNVEATRRASQLLSKALEVYPGRTS